MNINVNIFLNNVNLNCFKNFIENENKNINSVFFSPQNVALNVGLVL